jgi:GNAT superfamily N-acetyltransferase
MRFREADLDDAEQVALLHADSWRRHYRGAYSDAYLTGDVVADRRRVWLSRLAAPAHNITFLAEDDAGLVGFVHVVFDHDERWGSLVDNLHVVHDRQRTGTGTALMTRAAAAVTRQAATRSMYLWVLAQNTAAQLFYRALGGTPTDRAKVADPGGVPGRLNGSPDSLRIVWRDVTELTRR